METYGLPRTRSFQMQLTLIAGSADGKDFVGAIKGIMEHMRTFIVSSWQLPGYLPTRV